jgi:putative nucleotidyltransferase with HDIG domain
MADNTQALASLRFVSRWGFVLIGVPAVAAALAVGYLVGDAARDGCSSVMAASACSIADAVLDPRDMDAVAAGTDAERLDSVVQASNTGASFHGMRVANTEGLVVYSTREGEAGGVVKACDASERALGGETCSEVMEECCLSPGSGRVFSVSAPLHLDGDDEVDGYTVSVQPYDDVLPAISRAVTVSASTILGAALLAFVGLQLVVRRSIAEIEEEQQNTERLNARLAASTSDMEVQALGTLQALLAAVDAKDSYTAAHSVNVAELTLAINCHLQHPGDAMNLERAALLHDIGKIGVGEHVLSKPAKLDAGEWTTMRQHPGAGAEIIAAIPFMAGIVDIVRHHHERWDGSGYPERLAGDDIPLEARILAVADSFDAMITKRPYSPALSAEQARDEMIRCSGRQFDPVVVEAFLEAFEVQGLRWASAGRKAGRYAPASSGDAPRS